MPNRNYTSGDGYRFGFNGKEKDDELKSGGNSYDYGARIYHPGIARWLSVDPMSDKYPAYTSFGFAANCPLLFMDPNGKWVVRINKADGVSSLAFDPEPGDNLQTLSIQLGLKESEVFDALKESGDIINIANNRSVTLKSLEVVKSINNYLNSSDIDQTNCSNAAMRINGINQSNAWPEGGDGGEASTNAMEDASNRIINEFTNIPECEGSLGNIVTFQSSIEAAKSSGDIINLSQFYQIKPGTQNYENFVSSQVKNADTQHYGVVLLKSKDGQNLQSIFEKPGTTPAVISNYPPNSGSSFTPAPANGNNSTGNSPVYKKE